MFKLISVISILFSSIPLISKAQKENNNWYFGGNAGISFNSGSPSLLTGGMVSTSEGSSSISDTSGALLFYTDGVKVWNKNHIQMPNGMSLAGHFSSTQVAQIVPSPANNQLYYIFTTRPLGGTSHYSVVDMTMDGGNGDVIFKNLLLDTLCSEKITAVKHANGHDVWVMLHGFNDNNFFAYLVTDLGVSSAPVISTIGRTFASGDEVGQMKFSTSGNHIALNCYQSNFVELFDFDITSGIVSNSKYITPPSSANEGYGLEFSIDENYLYASFHLSKNIFQFDISSGDTAIINSSALMIGNSVTSLDALQLAPDGKIYVAEYGQHSIGVINNPDVLGLGANFTANAVSLGVGTSYFGLPNFVQSSLKTVGVEEFSDDSELLVFPNPFTEEVNILVKDFYSKQLKIVVYDQLGRIIFNDEKVAMERSGSMKIRLAGLPKGIYFLEIVSGSERLTKKLSKTN